MYLHVYNALYYTCSIIIVTCNSVQGKTDLHCTRDVMTAKVKTEQGSVEENRQDLSLGHRLVLAATLELLLCSVYTSLVSYIYTHILGNTCTVTYIVICTRQYTQVT